MLYPFANQHQSQIDLARLALAFLLTVAFRVAYQEAAPNVRSSPASQHRQHIAIAEKEGRRARESAPQSWPFGSGSTDRPLSYKAAVFCTGHEVVKVEAGYVRSKLRPSGGCKRPIDLQLGA